jgi:NADPH:quinone reductase-like Zn-dependent oxidoreductase
MDMRAIVLREFGGPEVLRWETVPRPAPGASEVLVRVGAVSVNRGYDVVIRKGLFDRPVPLPFILGTDPSGTVEEVGPGVDPAWIGRRVVSSGGGRCGACDACRAGEACTVTRQLGLADPGGYAEYVAVPVHQAQPLPDNLPFPEATFVARHFPTALCELERAAKVQPGEWVLVMGAAGPLGSSLLQVARLNDARVIGAAGTDERAQACLDLGAHFAINYRRQDLEAEVRRITGDRGVGAVCENIGDPTLWPAAFRSLAQGGRLVTVGFHGGGTVPLDVQLLQHRRLNVLSSPPPSADDRRRALDLAAAGTVHAVIGLRLPLAEAAEAHRIAEANTVVGKVILEP